MASGNSNDEISSDLTTGEIASLSYFDAQPDPLIQEPTFYKEIGSDTPAQESINDAANQISKSVADVKFCFFFLSLICLAKVVCAIMLVIDSEFVISSGHLILVIFVFLSSVLTVAVHLLTALSYRGAGKLPYILFHVFMLILCSTSVILSALPLRQIAVYNISLKDYFSYCMAITVASFLEVALHGYCIGFIYNGPSTEIQQPPISETERQPSDSLFASQYERLPELIFSTSQGVYLQKLLRFYFLSMWCIKLSTMAEILFTALFIRSLVGLGETNTAKVTFSFFSGALTLLSCLYQIGLAYRNMSGKLAPSKIFFHAQIVNVFLSVLQLVVCLLMAYPFNNSDKSPWYHLAVSVTASVCLLFLVLNSLLCRRIWFALEQFTNDTETSRQPDQSSLNTVA